MEWESTVGLLQIADLAKNWPALRGLHDLAMAQLVDMNTVALAELKDRADKLAAEQANVQAERASQMAKAQANEEAQVKAQEEAKARSMPKVIPAKQLQGEDANLADRRI